MGETTATRWVAEARRTHDEVVEALSAGQLSLAEVIEAAATDRLVARIDVVAVVQALPGWGKVRARRVLAELDIGERSPIGDVDGAALIRGFGRSP